MLLMNYVDIGNKLAATPVMSTTASMSVTPHTNLDIFGLHIRNTLLLVEAKLVAHTKSFQKPGDSQPICVLSGFLRLFSGRWR